MRQKAYGKRRGEPAHPDELVTHATLATCLAVQGDGFAWKLRRNGPMTRYPIRPIFVAYDPEVLKAPLLAGAGLLLPATDLIMQPLVAQGKVRAVLADDPDHNITLPLTTSTTEFVARCLQSPASTTSEGQSGGTSGHLSLRRTNSHTKLTQVQYRHHTRGNHPFEQSASDTHYYEVSPEEVGTNIERVIAPSNRATVLQYKGDVTVLRLENSNSLTDP